MNSPELEKRFEELLDAIYALEDLVLEMEKEMVE